MIKNGELEVAGYVTLASSFLQGIALDIGTLFHDDNEPYTSII
jgi:hypothetical protein